ncbi:MAG: hypothetical protein J7J38_03315 [Candidatus Aenigmarchaeota archaeon]|nr:hypothetical protein [Candidatus Aenigmarchaeota archaeon]
MRTSADKVKKCIENAKPCEEADEVVETMSGCLLVLRTYSVGSPTTANR